MVRPRFDLRLDAGRPMLAASAFTYDGKDYEPGDVFPVEGLDARRVATMHGARRINFKEDRQQAARDERRARREELTGESNSPVQIAPQPGGYYQISAPWLDEPVRIRGKGKAEAEVKRLREEGEPESHHGYTLTEGENGWWKIVRADDEAAEPVSLNVQGEANARETVAMLRAGEEIEGPLPAEWNPPEPLKVGDVVLVAETAEGELAGRRGTINEIRDDLAEVYSFGETEETKAELTKGIVPLADLSRTEATKEEQGNDAT